MDTVYKAQPFVNVVGKNENTFGLEVISKAQPFIAAYDNKLNGPVLSGNNHPDVQIWINTVSFNGGSASSGTISALNTFCNSIDSAGLRNKFIRLNLFCGSNLNACLVPLYTGPSSSYGLQIHGYGSDMNILKVAGSDDFSYSESLGLLGNTQSLTSSISRRYLDTGVVLGLIPSLSNNIHYSIYSNNVTTGGYPMGVYQSASNGFEFGLTSTDFFLGAFANSTLTYANSSSPKSLPSNNKLYTSTYSNNILNFYGGRANRLGYRDITSFPITLPNSNTVAIFAEGRNTVDPPRYAIFNYIDRLQAYSIGESISSTQIESYYDAIYAFQNTLGRS
jgi:hypothetical protein